MLIEAAVEVDTADAVAEDEPQGSASRARGRVGTPSAWVCNGGPTAGVRAQRALVQVVDPSGATGELDGQASRGLYLRGAVMSDSASGRAKARVHSRPLFERSRAVFACPHVSYCNG